MSKIDFEKDRRRRLPRDICADAPWRNEDTSVVARLGPRPEYSFPGENRPARRKKAAAFVPLLDGTLETLKSMAKDLRHRFFSDYPPWRKLEELNRIQARMARIVEREGAAIKSTRQYKVAEAVCKREATALRRLAKRKTK